MKPRLTPARLTPEDMEISVRVSMWPGFVDCFALSDVGTECDRRDADLMLQLTQFDHWERDYTQDRLHRWPTAKRVVVRQI